MLSYVWAYNPRGQYTAHLYNRYEEGYRNGIQKLDAEYGYFCCLGTDVV